MNKNKSLTKEEIVQYQNQLDLYEIAKSVFLLKNEKLQKDFFLQLERSKINWEFDPVFNLQYLSEATLSKLKILNDESLVEFICKNGREKDVFNLKKLNVNLDCLYLKSLPAASSPFAFSRKINALNLAVDNKNYSAVIGFIKNGLNFNLQNDTAKFFGFTQSSFLFSLKLFPPNEILEILKETKDFLKLEEADVCNLFDCVISSISNNKESSKEIIPLFDYINCNYNNCLNNYNYKIIKSTKSLQSGNLDDIVIFITNKYQCFDLIDYLIDKKIIDKNRCRKIFLSINEKDQNKSFIFNDYFSFTVKSNDIVKLEKLLELCDFNFSSPKIEDLGAINKLKSKVIKIAQNNVNSLTLSSYKIMKSEFNIFSFYKKLANNISNDTHETFCNILINKITKEFEGEKTETLLNKDFITFIDSILLNSSEKEKHNFTKNFIFKILSEKINFNTLKITPQEINVILKKYFDNTNIEFKKSLLDDLSLNLKNLNNAKNIKEVLNNVNVFSSFFESILDEKEDKLSLKVNQILKSIEQNKNLTSLNSLIQKEMLKIDTNKAQTANVRIKRI